MGMGGMGGAYATGNTFDNLKAKGELHGDLNERVARVTKKSRSMEMALKERVAEERRAAFFFALGKHQIEAANMLRGTEKVDLETFKALANKLLNLGWSDDVCAELFRNLDMSDGSMENSVGVADLLRAARAEIISRHGSQTTRRAAASNQAMFAWEEKWRVKNEAIKESHSRKVLRDLAVREKRERERVLYGIRSQRMTNIARHEARAALERACFPEDGSVVSPLRSPPSPLRSPLPRSQGGGGSWTGSGPLRSSPSSPVFGRTTAASGWTSPTREGGATTQMLILRSSTSESTLAPDLVLPMVSPAKGSRETTPFNVQVRRLETPHTLPALGMGRLDCSLGPVRSIESPA